MQIYDYSSIRHLLNDKLERSLFKKSKEKWVWTEVWCKKSSQVLISIGKYWEDSTRTRVSWRIEKVPIWFFLKLILNNILHLKNRFFPNKGVSRARPFLHESVQLRVILSHYYVTIFFTINTFQTRWNFKPVHYLGSYLYASMYFDSNRAVKCKWYGRKGTTSGRVRFMIATWFQHKLSTSSSPSGLPFANLLSDLPIYILA